MTVLRFPVAFGGGLGPLVFWGRDMSEEQAEEGRIAENREMLQGAGRTGGYRNDRLAGGI